ncbi:MULTISPECIES: hypothetical protein [unclassified Microcoleus]|uniref:hypothetical protein n=2 Tax=unclassified Microcoleus TaxID=2642155 RepID=UPI001E11C7A2|nr:MULTISPECIES: hypothetical protein [unclassified Microcoleus]MCC3517481.1 hypothetical protein [Microcoleus sp. PH2017_18_LLB_O_A]MCC3595613.1 hypothetical protein [Microcoleus sp. PH2017_26_ELK_O_A]
MLYPCYNLNKSKASAELSSGPRWLMAPHIHKETITMVKPVSDVSEYTRGYQQALNDFGVTQLLSGIRSYSDDDFDADRAQLTQQELESFAVFLILRVGANLNGSAIARYLNTLRKADSPIVGGDRNSWAIVRILPNAEHYTVARFVNR